MTSTVASAKDSVTVPPAGTTGGASKRNVDVTGVGKASGLGVACPPAVAGVVSTLRYAGKMLLGAWSEGVAGVTKNIGQRDRGSSRVSSDAESVPFR